MESNGGSFISEVRTIIATSNQNFSVLNNSTNINTDSSSGILNQNIIQETEAIVSPNSSEDEFQLMIKEGVQSVNLFNSNGIQVFSYGIIVQNQGITLGKSLAGGLYIIKIIYESGRTEIKKIQKL